MIDGFNGQREVVLPPMVVDMEHNDILTSSLYVTDIGYYPHASHHYRTREQGIEEHVLIYCVDGAGWYRVGGREYQVEEGQFFVLPAHRPHAYGAAKGDKAWTIYWLHFSGTQAPVYAEGALEPQSIRTATNSRISDRNNIFEEIMQTLQGGYSLEHLRYASALLHHYLASMRYLELYRSQADEKGNYVDPVSAAIHYMRENIEHHVTVDDVLRYVGYSQSHFTSLFKQSTGYSPINYFNQLKVQAACRYLDETNMRVNQICHKVGIEDSYYFSRLFTRVMGLSPTEYRSRTRS